MGGAIGVGNMSPAAEFNILADPEAARIVLGNSREDMPVYMVCTHSHSRTAMGI
jgi:inosine-uridine nucleoside N-ribohydrolase